MFSYNSKFNQIVNQVIDYFFLSLLWFISSLPVITIGAATTALYHTVDKVFRREEGGIWKEYWRVFRRDFKRATGLWIIMVLIIAVLVINFYAAFSTGVTNERLQVALQICTVFLTALMAIWLQYWFPYLSRFDDPVKRILKNTLAMMMTETGSDLRLLALIVFVSTVDILFSRYVPVLVILLPVAYVISLNRVLEKIFVRYISKQELSAEYGS